MITVQDTLQFSRFAILILSIGLIFQTELHDKASLWSLLASRITEQLRKQEAQLKARIQREKAKISASSRKERTGKLVAWGGVAVEQLLTDETFKAEWWKIQCQRVLSGRTLERALLEEIRIE